MRFANNKPTDFERIAVDIGRLKKRALVKYATAKRKSVSCVIRDLIDNLLEVEK